MKDLRTASDDELADRARSRMGIAPIAVDDEDLERIDRLGTVPASELLRALPAEQAEAVRARVFDEQPYSAIAEQLQCSPLVARKRVSRGLATLRSIVVDEEAS